MTREKILAIANKVKNETKKKIEDKWITNSLKELEEVFGPGFVIDEYDE